MVVSSQHSVEGIDCMVATKTAYNTRNKSSSIQQNHTCPCTDPLLPAFFSNVHIFDENNFYYRIWLSCLSVNCMHTLALVPACSALLFSIKLHCSKLSYANEAVSAFWNIWCGFSRQLIHCIECRTWWTDNIFSDWISMTFAKLLQQCYLLGEGQA